MSDSVVIDSVPETARQRFTALEKAVLLTVHYRDLFQHPLTDGELHKFLLLVPAEMDEVQAAVHKLQRTHLSRVGEYITWKGRECVIDERRARLRTSARVWPKARAYGGIMRQIPFLRMAGISGSLAVNHVSEDRDDIDVFCIAEPNRVWLAMLLLKILYAYSRRVGGMRYVCPNTCLASDRLEITTQNLYMAHQIVHVVPMWGEELYAKFLRRNRWVARFLPNAYAQQLSSPNAAVSRQSTAIFFSHWSERFVPCAVADRLNTSICRAGVRKASAFYRASHTDKMLHDARNPHRYMIPGLGYTGTIYRRFMDGHASRFADVLSREEMDTAFGQGNDFFFDSRLDGLFRSKYENRH